MSIYIEDNKTHTVRSYYTSPKIEETIEILLRSNEELMHSETLPGYKVDFVEMEEAKEVVNMRDATSEESAVEIFIGNKTKNEDQEPKYCDRNICTSNEYNGIGCDECEVTKSQEKTSDFTEEDISGKYYGHEEYTLTDEDIDKLKAGKKLYATWDAEYTISLEYKK